MTNTQTKFITAYAILLLVCVSLMLATEILGPTTREQILPVATDGFKMVLGALIGALSSMLGTKST